jgi:hypothetical protein
MREQLIQYVNLLFAGSSDHYDMRQEILQNTLDRYDDLVAQGKTPEAAYRLAIAGIGDVQEIFGNISCAEAVPSAPTVQESNTDHRGVPMESKRKTMRAASIGLYICAVIPVIALGNVGSGVIGVCLMFMMIAAATVLMVMSSNGSKESEEKADDEPKTELGKAIKSVWGIVTVGIYLAVSFWSGAWFITWLIFPIMAALQGLIKAIMDMKEEK